jgi:hypothetical protein
MKIRPIFSAEMNIHKIDPCSLTDTLAGGFGISVGRPETEAGVVRKSAGPTVFAGRRGRTGADSKNGALAFPKR